jgi:lipopolysaccharide transport system permease protein
VRLHDAAVDASATAEIVSVDDDELQSSHHGQDSFTPAIYSNLVQTEQEASAAPQPGSGHFGGATPLHRVLRWSVRSVDLLRVLTESDLRIRYGRGPWRFVRWLLEPVALVGVYLILVTFVLDRPGRAPGLSLTCAVVPFQLVLLTIANAMTALDARRPILLNMAFKRMLLPASSALSESAAFWSSILLLVAMMAAYGIAPTWNVLWFPVVWLVNFLLAASAAYGATLLGIWLRELTAFVLSFVRTLFFLGPGLVPLEQTSEDVRSLLRLNPLTGLFEGYRDVFLYGQPPSAWELLYPLAAAVVLLVVFLPIYWVEQRQFAKVV